MAWDKGVGSCLIPNAAGVPCGGHIGEGEPIGTIISASRQPLVGHKRCADQYTFNQANPPRSEPVKIGKQNGPGGAINPQEFPDALAFGSIPLEKPEPPERPGYEARLADVKMPEGVKSVADIPFDEPEPHPARREDPPYTGTETEPVDPQLRDRVMNEAAKTNVYKDGFRGNTRPMWQPQLEGNDWSMLIAILSSHDVPINAKLLQDLVDWKTR